MHDEIDQSTEPPDFRAIDDKISRAEEHLHEIGDRVTAYLKNDPPPIRGEVKLYDGGRRLERNVQITGMPIRVLTIVGEFAHNLRSALDQLAWQLVLASGGTPTEWTYFPIDRTGPTPDRFGRRKPPHVAGGVGDEAIQIIEAVQPYVWEPATEMHPLALLRHVSNTDKHRTRVEGRLSLHEPLFAIGGTAEGFEWSGRLVIESVANHRAEVGFLPTVDQPPADVHGSSTFEVEVLHADDTPVPLVQGLAYLLQFVREHVVAPLQRTITL